MAATIKKGSKVSIASACFSMYAYKELKKQLGGIVWQCRIKVNRYYSTGWQEADSLALKVDGLSVDAIYENFIRQIAGDALATAAPGENIKETVNRDEKRQALKNK